MDEIHLKCVPPSVTAQQKRIRVVNGKPVFFHGARMRREAQTWAALLAPYAPKTPWFGPISLTISLTWPHLKKTRKNDRRTLMPKTTKPDAGNAVKHLEDVLVKLGFMNDDAQIAHLEVTKWFGPEESVGIRIQLERI